MTVAGILVAAAAPASAATANPTPAAGARRNATRLNFAVSGTASLSVDVGSGNALFTDRLFTLPGIGQDFPVSLFYNSSVFGSSTPSAVTGDTGSGWGITGFDQRLVDNGDGSVTYYGPNGLTGVFPSNGSGGYVAPPQFQADLVAVSGGGWTLTDHASQTKLTFTAGGRLTASADRNGNVTSFSYDMYGAPAKIASTRGATLTRTLSIDSTYRRINTLSQTDGSQTRTVTLGYSSGGKLTSVTDTAGGITQFSSGGGTDTGQLVEVTNPAGGTTTLGFTADGETSSVTQSNAAGAGTATTRLTYPSATQTLVADPTTDQSQAVSAVPHTTYALTADGSQRVASATDANGHARSATYTSLGQITTATPAGGGTTTFSYGANNGESLTSVASPGGATGSAAYGNSGAAAYLPSSSTDDAGNATVYSYDGAGNQTSTAQGSGPQATVTYNSDGTAATSASPGAASGVVTSYSYEAGTHNLTRITPPTGTSLGARDYTWDNFGRLATAGDGRGTITSDRYDALDRITLIYYSDAATHDVSYRYDTLGRLLSRSDGRRRDQLQLRRPRPSAVGREHRRRRHDPLQLRPGRRARLRDRRARHHHLPLRPGAPTGLHDLPAGRQPR